VKVKRNFKILDLMQPIMTFDLLRPFETPVVV